MADLHKNIGEKDQVRSLWMTSSIYVLLLIILLMPGLQCGGGEEAPYPDSNVGMHMSFGEPDVQDNPKASETNDNAEKSSPEEVEKPVEETTPPDDVYKDNNSESDVTVPEDETKPEETKPDKVVKDTPENKKTEEDTEKKDEVKDGYNPENPGDGDKPKGNPDVKDKYDESGDGKSDKNGPGDGLGDPGNSKEAKFNSKYFKWPEIPSFRNCGFDTKIKEVVTFRISDLGKASRFVWPENSTLTSSQQSCMEEKLKNMTFIYKGPGLEQEDKNVSVEINLVR